MLICIRISVQVQYRILTNNEFFDANQTLDTVAAFDADREGELSDLCRRTADIILAILAMTRDACRRTIGPCERDVVGTQSMVTEFQLFHRFALINLYFRFANRTDIRSYGELAARQTLGLNAVVERRYVERIFTYFAQSLTAQDQRVTYLGRFLDGQINTGSFFVFPDYAGLAHLVVFRIIGDSAREVLCLQYYLRRVITLDVFYTWNLCYAQRETAEQTVVSALDKNHLLTGRDVKTTDGLICRNRHLLFNSIDSDFEDLVVLRFAGFYFLVRSVKRELVISLYVQLNGVAL